MRKTYIIILMAFLFASCSSATVYEYTAVFENTTNGNMDTIVGNMISFNHRYVEHPECELCTDGLQWTIRGNWRQGIPTGNTIYLGTYWDSKPMYFSKRIVDRCKIGFFETKVYPKYKRQKYSDILYN